MELQADAAGRTNGANVAKGEKKREKTSTSSKENEQGTKREKKRVSLSNVTETETVLNVDLDVALVPFCCWWKENHQGGKSLEKDADDRETCC